MPDPTQAEPGGFVTSVRKAVGIFRSEQELQDAIDDLLINGFARCELSLRGAEDATMDTMAADRTPEALGNAEGLSIGGFASLPAFGAADAAGAGMLAIGGLTVISGGAGAIVGAALAALLAWHHADNLTEQLAEGGLLLWARTRSPKVEPPALGILARHAGMHVHSHSLTA